MTKELFLPLKYKITTHKSYHIILYLESTLFQVISEKIAPTLLKLFKYNFNFSIF